MTMSPKDAAWWTAVLILIRNIIVVLSASSRDDLIEKAASGVLFLVAYPTIIYLIVKTIYGYRGSKLNTEKSGQDKMSIIQTIGATVVCSLVFAACFIVVALIATYILDWFGRIFVPARYGGGSEIDNPGILNSIMRVGLMVFSSGYAGYIASAKLFPKVKTGHLACGILLVIIVAALSVVQKQ